MTTMLDHAARMGVTPGRLSIDGSWCEAQEGKRWSHVHPATNEEITTIARAGQADVDRAVRAARTAFDDGPWPRLKARQR